MQIIDKDHDRTETRITSRSHNVQWLLPKDHRRYPGHPHFPTLKSLVRAVTRSEHRGKIAEQTRLLHRLCGVITQSTGLIK